MNYEKLLTYISGARREMANLKQGIEMKRREISAFESKIIEKDVCIQFLGYMHGKIFNAISSGQQTVVMPITLSNRIENSETFPSDYIENLWSVIKGLDLADLRIESAEEYLLRCGPKVVPIKTYTDYVISFSVL